MIKEVDIIKITYTTGNLSVKYLPASRDPSNSKLMDAI